MEPLLLLLFGLGGMAFIGVRGDRSARKKGWSGAVGEKKVESCSVPYPLLGNLDPHLIRQVTPSGWTMAWLGNRDHLIAWSAAMQHDIFGFMANRPRTEFAFGIADPSFRPRATFILKWVEAHPAHWEVNFAQGPGGSAVDLETTAALMEFGRVVGLDCPPIAG